MNVLFSLGSVYGSFNLNFALAILVVFSSITKSAKSIIT